MLIYKNNTLSFDFQEAECSHRTKAESFNPETQTDIVYRSTGQPARRFVEMQALELLLI